MRPDSRLSRPAPSRRIAFDGGTRTLFGFGVAIAAMVVLSIVVGSAVSDVSFSVWVAPVAGVAKFGVLAGVTLLVLRAEGVRPAELGLSKRLIGPALLAGIGLWTVLNVVVIGLAITAGNQWGLARLSEIPARWPGLPAPVLFSLGFDLFVVAIVEEFVFRGYLQTKVIALLGDDSRARIGLGILTASVVFGALHAPGAILQGASPSGVLGTVAFLSLSGVGFGLLYELTHNLYFVALLHTVGNTWPLVADVWSWSGSALVGTLVAILVLYIGTTIAYRFWLVDTALTPVVDRFDERSLVRSDGTDPSGS